MFSLPHFFIFGMNRSSYRRCSVKKGVLKNFAKFTGKNQCQSLRLWCRCFPVNFAKFLRTLFLRTLSDDCFWMNMVKIQGRIQNPVKQAFCYNSQRIKEKTQYLGWKTLSIGTFWYFLVYITGSMQSYSGWYFLILGPNT